MTDASTKGTFRYEKEKIFMPYLSKYDNKGLKIQIPKFRIGVI